MPDCGEADHHGLSYHLHDATSPRRRALIDDRIIDAADGSKISIPKLRLSLKSGGVRLWRQGNCHPFARCVQGRPEGLGSDWLLVDPVRLCKPSRTIQPRLVRSTSRCSGGRDAGMAEGLAPERVSPAKLAGRLGSGCANAGTLASPAQRIASQRRARISLPFPGWCWVFVKC